MADSSAPHPEQQVDLNIVVNSQAALIANLVQLVQSATISNELKRTAILTVERRLASPGTPPGA